VTAASITAGLGEIRALRPDSGSKAGRWQWRCQGSLQGLPTRELEDYLCRLWRALRAAGPDSAARSVITQAIARVLTEMDYQEALAARHDQARAAIAPPQRARQRAVHLPRSPRAAEENR
jgi:hypothetical protein